MTESAAGLIKKDQRVKILEDNDTQYLIEVDEGDTKAMKDRYGALESMNEQR